jgi:hypothetical protein
VLNQGWRYGSYDLALHQNGGDRPIEFDAGAAEPGWSSLGDFQLDRGAVEVTLSDETSGSVVIADALRFVALDAAVETATETSTRTPSGGAP